ncbi:MAG: signal peptidase I [Clostridia bacterium]|nr:signal peptidase I [Clostridia bacterium]
MKKLTEGLFEFMSVVTSAVVAIAVIFTLFFRLTTVSGKSMQPTLYHEDKLITTAYSDTYEYKDIVIVVEPNEELYEPLVKRVIATEGQWVTVDYDSGLVYVGDTVDTMNALDEDYTASLTNEKPWFDTNEYPIQVPENSYFCMGDNRNNSTDSRAYYVGFVDESYILGKAIFRLSPFGSIY